jgi:hypothetical protein
MDLCRLFLKTLYLLVNRVDSTSLLDVQSQRLDKTGYSPLVSSHFITRVGEARQQRQSSLPAFNHSNFTSIWLYGAIFKKNVRSGASPAIRDVSTQDGRWVDRD